MLLSLASSYLSRFPAGRESDTLPVLLCGLPLLWDTTTLTHFNLARPQCTYICLKKKKKALSSLPDPTITLNPFSSPFVAVCSQLQGSLYAGLGGPVRNVVG